MYIYIRKLFDNDAKRNQISFTKEVAQSFFNAPDEFLDKTSKTNISIDVFYYYDPKGEITSIELQPATDYRISTHLNTFLASKGEPIEVGDLLYIERIGKNQFKFGVKLIKQDDDPQYSVYSNLLNEKNRHLLICSDDEDPVEKYRPNDPRQIIWYGAPGTGKSFAVNEIVKKNNFLRITFHPDVDYSSFVGSYKPTLKPVKPQYQSIQGREEEISYKFVPQIFLKAYVNAWKKYCENPEEPEPFYLVIEEINRGNCAQIFGDLFQLLDRDDNGYSTFEISPDTDIANSLKESEEDGFKNSVAVKNFTQEIKEGKILKLPSNLFIYGTMNTSDQSLFPIDSAFKRRWKWKYVPIEQPDGDPRKWKIVANKHWCYLWEFLLGINAIIEKTTHSEDKQLGYFFIKPDNEENISAESFVSKVIFYLWNDVFKDEDNSIFKYKKLEGQWAVSDSDINRNENDDIFFRNFVKNRNEVNEELVHWFINNILFDQKVPLLDEKQNQTQNGDKAYMRPFTSNEHPSISSSNDNSDENLEKENTVSTSLTEEDKEENQGDENQTEINKDDVIKEN